MKPNDEVENLVGPRVEVTDDVLEACRANDQFGALVYELYKETGRLVCASSGAYFGHGGDSIAFDRNQAICAGLLVRIFKYMLSVAKLSADIEHGETVQALNRCIVESAVNLRYFLLKDEDATYDKFVKNSLVAERELYDIIQENVQARGGERLVIEQRMLNSIIETCDKAGVKPEEVNPKAGSWGGSFRDRLEALGYGWQAYTILERIPAHAIHGDWVDLVLNHLLLTQDGFEPDYDHLRTDGGLLSPIAIFVVEAARDYLHKFFENAEADSLHYRLVSVQERLQIVESAGNDWQIVDDPDL